MTKDISDVWQARIDEIMRNFDFVKVRNVMLHLDWKWAGEKEYYLPTIDQLKETADELLRRSIEIAGFTSTGGFRAVCQDECLSLVFEVESWDAYED